MKRTLRVFLKILFYSVAFITLVALGLWVTGYGYINKGIALTYLRGYTSASIDDYKYFDSVKSVASPVPQPWEEADTYNNIELSPELQAAHEKYESIAWLVIQHNKIIQEHYWDFGSQTSLSNSFSMSKTIVSLCLFKAIEEGKIKSLDEPVYHYFPEYKDSLGSKLTVGDLSDMSSGLNWEESYSSPFSITTKAYYGKNLKDLILHLKVIEEPGKRYNYQSGNVSLLTMVIEKAVDTTLAAYAAQKFWIPMGAEHDALWGMDQKGGMEKGYCCFNSNARDFARWGKLALNYGNWNGKQLLDSSYIIKATQPAFKETPFYGYSFWLDNSIDHLKVYFFRGILGQYIICIPEKDMIIVRLGKKRGDKHNARPHPDDYYIWVKEALKLCKTNG